MTGAVFVVADPHLGNHKAFGGPLQAGLNARCLMVLDTLRQVGEAAREHPGKATVVVAGDMFDVASPSPQVIRAMQRVIVESRVAWVILKGNHDSMSGAPEDHALGPLEPVATVVADAPRVIALPGFDLLCVPFQPGPGDEWLPEAVARLVPYARSKRRVLVLHLGVRDAETSVYLRDAPDSVDLEILRGLQEEHGIEVACAGNWHDHRRWPATEESPWETVQVGTLAPTGWDNPGMRGRGLVAGVSFEEAATIELYTVPGPRFLVLEGALGEGKLAALRKAKERGHHVFVERPSTSAEMATTRAQLEAWVTDGLILGWRTPLVDKDADRVAARAVEAARSASTVEDALGAFVGGMRLREGVERTEVLSRSRGYLERRV